MPPTDPPNPSTPFKEGINAEVVRAYADGLAHVPGFDPTSFTAATVPALDALELKARVQHVAAALLEHLGGDYAFALSALMEMLEEHTANDRPSYAFVHWPMAQFVEDYGPDVPEHFAASVAAMKAITRHFSCEFAVRPFLERYPEAMLAVMHDWATDPDVHVRRNASEGMRPRLPWGGHLTAFIDDPAPVFELLATLREDPEAYVRRSVSNALNDIAKDHPQRLMDVLEAWGTEGDAHHLWIRKRALRTLVKDGDPRALALLGFHPPQVRVEDLAVDAATYRVGDTLQISFTLVSEGDAPQRLELDYRVHYVKKSGLTSPKVFKLKTMTLQPGERVSIVRKQHLKPISTRRYHAGLHRVDVQVNGQVFGDVPFDLAL